MLPLDMQKNIPMIICLAQKEVHLQGFGSAHCMREVFMKVYYVSLINVFFFYFVTFFFFKILDNEIYIFIFHGTKEIDL